jgi:hypothetical protein
MEESKATAATGLDLPVTLGALNPVGSVVMVVPGGDPAADKARDALNAGGIATDDIEVINSERMRLWLEEQFEDTSRLSGFGAEVSFMRRYLPLAREGCGWLLIKVDDDAARDTVVRVAQQSKARIAVKYNRLAHEELPVEPGMVPADTPGL